MECLYFVLIFFLNCYLIDFQFESSSINFPILCCCFPPFIAYSLSFETHHFICHYFSWNDQIVPWSEFIQLFSMCFDHQNLKYYELELGFFWVTPNIFTNPCLSKDNCLYVFFYNDHILPSMYILDLCKLLLVHQLSSTPFDHSEYWHISINKFILDKIFYYNQANVWCNSNKMYVRKGEISSDES